MADALLSKEHFYVNASYYNDTDVDREAVIHIQDNQDILNRSDDWMVHITRFSCDSMQSLPYIVKDDSALSNQRPTAVLPPNPRMVCQCTVG